MVVDLPPGTYSYFCTIHYPVMAGSNEVVADDAAPDNPAPEDFADLIGELTAEADELFAELAKPSFVQEDGRRVWTVHAGARTSDVGAVSIEAFLPASLDVEAGDAVRWRVHDAVHAVTFPDRATVPGGGGLPLYYEFNCELDEPGGGLPGVPLLGLLEVLPTQVECQLGSLEIAFTPAVDPQHAPGDAVPTPATYHNSGMLVHPDLPERHRGRPMGSGAHFPAEFEATFPVPSSEPFTYRCYVHFGFMNGAINVR